jgi:hypothetical protein
MKKIFNYTYKEDLISAIVAFLEESVEYPCPDIIIEMIPKS